MRDLAAMLRKSLGDKPDVVYVDAPFAVQFYLGYLRFNAHAPAAAARLNSPEAAHVLASRRAAQRLVATVTNRVFFLYQWPSGANPAVELLSNRPTLPP